MNVNQAKQPQDGLDAEDVAAYLEANPDFFLHQHDLLEVLKIPHPCGDAVSLVAKQMEILRDKNRKLQAQLNDIVQIARENDAVFRRIHELTLVLLDADSIDDALASLRWILHEAFHAEFITLRVFEPRPVTAVADLYAEPDSVEFDPIRSILKAGVPVCGEPDSQKALCLFQSNLAEVLSYALIPLSHAGLKGFLAVGSGCAERFRTGMGNFFLAQMGEIVASRLADLLRRIPADHER